MRNLCGNETLKAQIEIGLEPNGSGAELAVPPAVLGRKAGKERTEGREGDGPPLTSSNCPKGVGRESVVLEAPTQERSTKER
jgi:hypothetical protein